MTDDRPSVELRIRGPIIESVDDRPREVYERLVELRDEGKIVDVSVEVWGRQVPVHTAADDPLVGPARTAYEEFERWARQTGHDLYPAFSTHTQGSLITEERTEAIRFPVVCLAVYDGGDLRAVAPCSTDDGVRTVDDCLEALQADSAVGTVVASDRSEQEGRGTGT